MSKRVVETRKISLGEQEYEFRVPKVAGILFALMHIRNLPENEREAYMIYEQVEWLKKGLGAEQWELIEGRLKDDDDILDFPDLSNSTLGLVGEVAGRPPTSSTVS